MTADAALLAALADCAAALRRLKERAMAIASGRHKHLRIDQAKLDKARRILDATTETETLDRALTLVVSEAEIDAALRHVARKGRLKKLFP